MSESSFKVTLLGTGTPIPSKDRFGPSTLIEAGDQKLLIDAGRGATIRLAQLGIPLGRIDALLLTHFHSDHTVGIPDLWLTGWLESHFGTRQSPFRVIGPGGANTLMADQKMHLTAPSRWSRSIGTGGRDPSERVVTIVGMRTLPGSAGRRRGAASSGAS